MCTTCMFCFVIMRTQKRGKNEEIQENGTFFIGLLGNVNLIILDKLPYRVHILRTKVIPDGILMKFSLGKFEQQNFYVH